VIDYETGEFVSGKLAYIRIHDYKATSAFESSLSAVQRRLKKTTSTKPTKKQDEIKRETGDQRSGTHAELVDSLGEKTPDNTHLFPEEGISISDALIDTLIDDLLSSISSEIKERTGGVSKDLNRQRRDDVIHVINVSRYKDAKRLAEIIYNNSNVIERDINTILYDSEQEKINFSADTLIQLLTI
ncbi:MAG: hypothetical protein NC116_12210, partial [Clostridium sp.]|nr:hypothetical protein [Clostridium sp.]